MYTDCHKEDSFLRVRLESKDVLDTMVSRASMAMLGHLAPGDRLEPRGHQEWMARRDQLEVKENQ